MHSFLKCFRLQGTRAQAFDSSSFLALFILTLFKTLPRVPVFVVIVTPSITVGGVHAKVKQIITPLRYQEWSNSPTLIYNYRLCLDHNWFYSPSIKAAPPLLLFSSLVQCDEVAWIYTMLHTSHSYFEKMTAWQKREEKRLSRLRQLLIAVSSKLKPTVMISAKIWAQ